MESHEHSAAAVAPKGPPASLAIGVPAVLSGRVEMPCSCPACPGEAACERRRRGEAERAGALSQADGSGEDAA